MKKSMFKKLIVVSAGLCLAGSLTACESQKTQAINENKAIQATNNKDFNNKGLKVSLKTYQVEKNKNFVVYTKVAKKCHEHVKVENIKNGKTNLATVWLFNDKNVYKLPKKCGRVIYRKDLKGAHLNVVAFWNGKRTVYTIRTKTTKKYVYNYAYNINKHNLTDGVTIALGQDATR